MCVSILLLPIAEVDHVYIYVVIYTFVRFRAYLQLNEALPGGPPSGPGGMGAMGGAMPPGLPGAPPGMGMGATGMPPIGMGGPVSPGGPGAGPGPGGPPGALPGAPGAGPQQPGQGSVDVKTTDVWSLLDKVFGNNRLNKKHNDTDSKR